METTNDLVFQKQTMTSREIAELTGKPHNDVIKAIRNMEDAWVKVGEGNFSLTYYTDQRNRKRPQYELNKSECLYIATKFNDVARAKLIVRWEKLERERLLNMPNFADPGEAAIAWAKQYRKNKLAEAKAKSA